MPLLQTLFAFLSVIPLMIMVIGSAILLRKITAASTILIFLGSLFLFLLVLAQTVLTMPPINITRSMDAKSIGQIFMGLQSFGILANLILGVGLLLFALNLPTRRRHG